MGERCEGGGLLTLAEEVLFLSSSASGLESEVTMKDLIMTILLSVSLAGWAGTAWDWGIKLTAVGAMAVFVIIWLIMLGAWRWTRDC